MECRECRKELFLSLMLADNAAFLYSIIFKKEYDAYECPAHPGDWHLTTERWRSKKRTGASKPPVTGQGRPRPC